MNIIWENRGIALGIILYLITYYNKMINKRIVIKNDKINYVIKTLFPNFKIRSSGKGFKIIIKSNNNGNLIINNLNNLDHIYAKKVRILPWYDKDNPMVMFRYNKKKKYDLDKLKDDLMEFSEGERHMIYSFGNIIEQYYGFKIWDTNMEFNILTMHSKIYHTNIMNVHHFLTRHVGGLKRDIVNYIPYKVQVPVEVPKYIPIKTPIETKIPSNRSNTKVGELINTITRKLEITNKLLDYK